MDSKGIKKPAKCSKSTSSSQRECENLQAMAVGLRTEWSKLKAEMDNLLKKCERVKDENKSIMEEITRIYGRDAISDLIAMESDAETESDNDEETTLSEQNQTADSSMLLEVGR
ncbi:PREDICTED: G-box-binding factor 1-like [Populus euphratica]|uniref:G-box-binding factor 1-like n=1 Tax=Populus euphratica TaxID=75702 RepID=A0AAJ6Y0G3_POPEU|nr:PREDICTED: G-box-binding factor 1-like [Populus euphratica]